MFLYCNAWTTNQYAFGTISSAYELRTAKNVRLTLFTDFDRRVVFQNEIKFDALNIACNINFPLLFLDTNGFPSSWEVINLVKYVKFASEVVLQAK